MAEIHASQTPEQEEDRGDDLGLLVVLGVILVIALATAFVLFR